MRFGLEVSEVHGALDRWNSNQLVFIIFPGPAAAPGVQQNWASAYIWVQHGVFLLPNMQEQSRTGRNKVRILSIVDLT